MADLKFGSWPRGWEARCRLETSSLVAERFAATSGSQERSSEPDYLGRVFSFSITRFNSSSFCPASPSLPSAVRRW
jgi:hypothetical protein